MKFIATDVEVVNRVRYNSHDMARYPNMPTAFFFTALRMGPSTDEVTATVKLVGTGGTLDVSNEAIADRIIHALQDVQI